MNGDNYLITASELLAKIGDPNLRIFDATIMFYMGMSPEEAAKMPAAHALYVAGHIPGAAFFEHQDFSDANSKYSHTLVPDEILADQIGKIGISNSSEVVVYSPGILATATRAWWILRYAGVENLRVLNGGLAAWKTAGGALEAGERTYPPTSFKPQFKPEMFANLEEVKAALDMADVRVENSLTQEWHDREHIPGSTCLPLTTLSIGWDAFLPEEERNTRLKAAGQHRRIITYCGGGIAATLNAMAHVMAGHENVAVYDGSLYEWMGEGMPVEGS